MEGTVFIYEHFDGFGIKCEGNPYNVLGIARIDTFRSKIEAYKIAKQIQKDAPCEIKWECEKPDWAVTHSEDTY